MNEKKRSKLHNFLNKDVNEFNKLLLSIVCMAILVIAGFASYYFTSSYAFFTHQVESDETINLRIQGVPTAVEFLTSQAENLGLKKIEHEMENETVIDYRYRGKDVNNYIEFDGELYRIIGIMPTVNDRLDEGDYRLKIIKDEPLIKNNKSSWSYEEVYPEAVAYSGQNLNNKYSFDQLAAIIRYTYILGEDLEDVSNSDITSDFIYIIEKGQEKIFDPERGENWYGKAEKYGDYYGSMYMSDYGYGASESCEEPLTNYSSYECRENNWLYSGKNEILEDIKEHESISYYIIKTNGNVDISNDSSYLENAEFYFRPTYYLNKNVKIIDGDGTKNNPYKLQKKLNESELEYYPD